MLYNEFMASQITLHGVEVKFQPNLATPISIGGQSTIGLVGSAPDSATSKAAVADTGSGDAAIRLTADAAGAAGNNISMSVSADAASQSLAVTLDPNDSQHIVVELATDALGEATSTATDTISAINTVAAGLAVATSAPGSSGAGFVRPTTRFSLIGGANEAFPLNVPTLVSSADAVRLLGDAGTLADAVRDVWRTAGRNGATVLAVRVAQGQTDLQTISNIIGARSNKSGIYALLDAQAHTGVRADIMAAPGWSDNVVCALALQTVARELYALAIVDAPSNSSLNQAGAAAYASKLKLALVLYPKIRIFQNGDTIERPASGLIAGHIARVDSDEGWHHSPSNREIFNVIGATPAIDFDISNPNSVANFLSEQFVGTIVRRDNGVYYWGNRLADGRLIPHYRVERIMASAISSYVANWVDRKINKAFINFLEDKTNEFLRDQVADGILTYGRAFYDPNKNSAATLAQNRVTLSVEISIPNVAEHIIINQQITNDGNEILNREASNDS